jgi:hypothetical protein
MGTTEQASPPTESALGVASAFLVGGGIITMALFPLLIPGLAVLAIFVVPLALPLIPLALLGALAWPFVRLRRRRRERARSAERDGAERAPRPSALPRSPAPDQAAIGRAAR